MKNIELTKTHKSKLLEMCKVLFSEYIIIQFQVKSKPESINLNFFHRKGVITIPWFEFCWKLLNKMLSNTETVSPVYVQKCITNFGMICFNNSNFQHPIDYLYEIFEQNEKI